MTALGGLPARSDNPQDGTGWAKDELIAAVCSPQSVGGHGYHYCDAHWQLRKLPVRFRVNTSGLPDGSNISAADFVTASRLAMTAWDLPSPVSGTGPRTGSCGASAKILCVSDVGTSGGAASDGVNTIYWGHMPGSPPGQTIVTYESVGSTRIFDVDIMLNSAYRWYWGEPQTLATGTAAGAAAFACIFCPDYKDVQSFLTHELGHAIGLLHPNPGAPSFWPEDPQDAPDYNLVMYARYYRNNATQRILGWGDLAGLNVAMSRSRSDP